MHGVGLGWGLPASEGWDDDGVAPRDFLVGIVQTYQTGDYFRYPPLHLIILAILTFPIWAVGLARASAHTPEAVVLQFIQVPYMTAFAVVARLVTVAMSLVLVYALARLGEEIGRSRTGLCVAVVVGLNAPFTYYSHTTNLDVPYLMWAVLALLQLARAMTRRQPGRLVSAGVLAGLAVATKDQAYALFLISVPGALVGWAALDPWARANLKEVARQSGRAALAGLVVLVLVDGVLINPTGFAARLGFLLGSASQDHAPYADSWAGRWTLLGDMVSAFPSFYPWPWAIMMVGGVLSLRRSRHGWAGLLPLLAALSFTLAFNGAARRCEHRFLLPQTVLAGFYGGLALEYALFEWRRWGRWLAAPLMLWALFKCLAVDVALLQDPRYEAEEWLARHVDAGDVVEVYGNQVYWPRLPSQARVVRVDTTPPRSRSALLDVTEVQQRLELVEERQPRWIVISEAWASGYCFDEEALRRAGHVLTAPQAAALADPGPRLYLERLRQGRELYRLAHVAGWSSSLWPRVQIHASTGYEIWVFQRERR